jgi:hypothetical protein
MRIHIWLLFQIALARGAAAGDTALLIYVPLDFGAPSASLPPDVEAVQGLLQKVYGFEDRTIRMLYRCQATTGADHSACEVTSARIQSALDDLVEATQPNDRVVIYWSGHGTRRRTYTTKPEDDECEEVLVTCEYDRQNCAGGLLDDQLAASLARLGDRRLVLIVDACFAGGVTKQFGGEWLSVPHVRGAGQGEKMIAPCCESRSTRTPVLESRPYVALLSSARHQKSAYEQTGRGPRSEFTRALVAAHCNAAADDDRDGLISFDEALRYTKQCLSPGQDPVYLGPAQHLSKPFLFATSQSLYPRIDRAEGDRVRLDRGILAGLDYGIADYEVRVGNAQSTALLRIEPAELGWSNAGAKLVRGGPVRVGDQVRPSLGGPAAPLPVMLAAGENVLDAKDLRRIVDAVPEASIEPSANPDGCLVRVVPDEDQWRAQLIDRLGMIVACSDLMDQEAARQTVPQLLAARVAVQHLRRVARHPSHQPGLIEKFDTLGGQRVFRVDDAKAAEAFRLEVCTAKPAWLTLIAVGATGQIALDLLPTPIETRPQLPTYIPPVPRTPYYIHSPAGLEHVFLLATSEPVPTEVLSTGFRRGGTAGLAAVIESVVTRCRYWSLRELIIESYVPTR